MREGKRNTKKTNKESQKAQFHPKGMQGALNTSNPEHLSFMYKELAFDILGGINTESYMMLRVMLVVRGNQKVERAHLDLYNHFELSRFQKRIAEKTGFALGFIEEAFHALINNLEIYKHGLIEEARDRVLPDLTKEAQKEALATLKRPDLLQQIQSLIAETGLVGHEKNSLVLFLIYLSRFDSQPLHAVIQSKQHYLQYMVGRCIPEEHLLHISYLSENALYYFEENELAHKLLLIEDTGTNKAHLQPLQDLQSRGVLRKTVTQKDAHGYLKTVQKRVYGPVCASISTQCEERFVHHAILSFVLEEESGDEHEQNLIRYEQKRQAGYINPLDEMMAQERIHNIQRLLKPIRVINPYAEQLELPLTLRNQSLSMAHYLRFIQTITFLKQYQRDLQVDSRSGEVFIETELKDIEEAHELLAKLLVHKCDPLNRPTRTYLKQLQAYIATKETERDFTNAEMHQVTHIPISTIKRYHQNLFQAGYITATGEGNRASGFRYTLTQGNDHALSEESIRASLKETLTTLTSHNGSPPPKVAQNKNGLPKPTGSKGLKQVAQKKQGGTYSPQKDTP